MTVLNFILLLLAAVCFLAATAGVAPARLNVLALGLFCWVLVPLIAAGRALD